MADSTTQTSAEHKSGTSGTTLPTSQEELNAIIRDRIARERKKYEDYEDLKAAKARLDEIEEANRSELEKAIKRAEKAEEKAANLAAQIEIRELADATGVSKEDLPLLAAVKDAAQRKALAERLAVAVKKDDDKDPESKKEEAEKIGFRLDGLADRKDIVTQSAEEAARAFFGV